MKKLLFVIVAFFIACSSLKAQSRVDTTHVGNFEIIFYGENGISVCPKNFHAVMSPLMTEFSVYVDLLNIPIELDPELDKDEYREAVNNHPWTRWKKEMVKRMLNTDIMKMAERQADSLGRSIPVYGRIYFSKNGDMLSFSISIPRCLYDAVSEQQWEQFYSVCMNEDCGRKIPSEVMEAVYLTESTLEFVESMKREILKHQERVAAGIPEFHGHFFNYYLPIEKRPKANYGELFFRWCFEKDTKRNEEEGVNVVL